MIEPVLSYIDKNKDHFLENLKNILKIESISAQPAKKEAVLKCADTEAKKFKEIGLENVSLIQTIGNPLVYGDWLHAGAKPTILIYGHYDVQPPDPLDQWKSPPFEPTVRDGNLYARGANDNKAQHYTHLSAIESYLKTVGKLPVNIKLVLEGEEEVGSGGIDDYVRKNAKFFSCDAVMISDTAWFDADTPSVVCSLRGLCYFEMSVKGPSHDLHSGSYGGMIRNPLQALSWILSKLKDENERILIPGFYDDVLALTPSEKKEIANLPFDDQKICKEAGVSQLVSEDDFTPLESNWARPTLDINGMWGGYQAPGAKTIIPAEAGAKISMRLVANQDPEKIAKQFKDYVSSICPKGALLQVNMHHYAYPVYVASDHFFVKQAALAYEKGFGRKMVFVREGASIPIVATLQSVLKVPVIMIGIGLPDDRLHSPNEKVSLSNFYGGIKGAALAYRALGENP